MAAAQVQLDPPSAMAVAVSEFDFLCSCLQVDRPVQAPLRAEINWDALLKLASYHRVLPAVHAALQRRGNIPANVRSTLNSQSIVHTRRILRFLAELSGILRQFSDCGIEVLAHKGPGLAQRLFGDPAMREFGDLDFLIRPAEVPRARLALEQLGLHCHLQLSQRQEREYLRTGYEYVFGSATEPNLIELQWQIVPRFYSIPFQFEALFRRSREFEIQGRPARMLADEDLMLTLCVHAAKHCWEQLGMVRDIATLARLPLNWQWIGSEAQKLGITKILLISLLLGKNLLGIEVPQELAAHPERENSETLGLIIEDRLRRSAQLNTKSLEYFRFFTGMRERRSDRLRFISRLALTPGVSDWQTQRLPDRLFHFYYGVRPLRLLRRIL